MKYICEIDVPWDGEDHCLELYCGRDCGWLEKKENKNRDNFPFCNVFHEKLKLDIALYEMPGILRCNKCRWAFYPAPDESFPA
jgi:hypothetical protein